MSFLDWQARSASGTIAVCGVAIRYTVIPRRVLHKRLDLAYRYRARKPRLQSGDAWPSWLPNTCSMSHTGFGTAGHAETSRWAERLGTVGLLQVVAKRGVAPIGRTKNLPDLSGQSVKSFLREDAERLGTARDAREAGGLQPADHPSGGPPTRRALWVAHVMEEPPAASQHAPQLVIERLAVEIARNRDHWRIVQDAREAAVLQRR